MREIISGGVSLILITSAAAVQNDNGCELKTVEIREKTENGLQKENSQNRVKAKRVQ